MLTKEELYKMLVVTDTIRTTTTPPIELHVDCDTTCLPERYRNKSTYTLSIHQTVIHHPDHAHQMKAYVAQLFHNYLYGEVRDELQTAHNRLLDLIHKLN